MFERNNAPSGLSENTSTDVERKGLGDAKAVAAFLGTTTNQLARLRFEGHGPNYVKLGRSVRYRWEDVHRWVDENVHVVGGDAA